MRPRSPWLARRILARALPSDVRDAVAGDLEEFFRRRLQRGGRLAATLWYWRQTAALCTRFAGERLRARHAHLNITAAFSWMDVKLGFRMLVRYPGLALVAVFGMAIGIAIAAGAYSIVHAFADPALPFDEGDRIVAIQNWDGELNRPERRVAPDFLTWKTDLRSVVDVGAYRQISRNLIVEGAQPETVRIAEMSASGFRVARVAPLLGRYLVDEDERAAAPPVVVLGAELWRTRFASDPGIVGRAIQLGAAQYTVVGIMPEGFGFPVNHRVWTPLRLNPAGYERRNGPSLLIFGRLAPGVALDHAQAELTAMGERMAAAFPTTHARLRPTVLPYTYPFISIDDPEMAWLFRLVQYVMAALLVVVCVNVAILVYARTATRRAEIAVRTALGASRRRIVGQLFVEALVLAAAAAVVGVALTSVALTRVNLAMLQNYPLLPFWWHFAVSNATLLYVAGLTLAAGAIVGVVPALKATGRRVQSGLQSISSGGGAGMQLGRMWTVLIVAQVGIAVALLPAAVFHAWDAMRYGTQDPGFAAHEFLTAQLVLDRAAATTPGTDVGEAEYSRRYAERQRALAGRLKQEGVVSDVTFVLDVPGEEPTVFVEAEGVAMPSQPGDYSLAAGTALGHMSRVSRVDLPFFDIFGVPLLAGRTFRPGDADPAATAVIANRTFAQQILGGGAAVGRRIRYVGRGGDTSPEHVALGRWYEIVGVVSDFPRQTDPTLAQAKLYHAAPPGAYPMTLAVRLRGTTPAGFTPRLRAISAALDPNLQLRNISSMDAVLRAGQAMMRLVAIGLGAVTLSVVVLSAAGIYALMSFTVARRRKEIGIRAALGADPSHLLRSIFARACAQLAAGAALGVAAAAALEVLTGGEVMKGHAAVVLPLVALLMLAVGLLAALGPARRGLRIPPIEALRQE